MTALAVRLGAGARRLDPAWSAIAVIVATLLALDPGQVPTSIRFVADAVLGILVFFVLSVLIAAYAAASGADNLIARAFEGRAAGATVAAALAGALSPFCSCGVIPLIAALLAMGVPLAPVMAFWLASPIMDPAMFVLTAGTLGTEFAVYKTVAAVGIGLLGGFGILAMARADVFRSPLKAGVGDGGCGGSKVRSPKPPVWRFWTEDARIEKFLGNLKSNSLFLGKWLLLAFTLESLMVAYVPSDLISGLVGSSDWLTVLGVTLLGIPAYLNGYAALPLVGGLIEQGMAPGAGMAFLLAGGVTSIPAAIAVFAIAKRPVFAAYLAFALVGAFAFGLGYGLIV